MLSWLWFLFSLLPLFFTLKSKATGQLFLRYTECNYSLGNFTHGSDYESNRNTVLEQIYSDRRIDYGFYHVSYGEVYAIALCIGDINQEDCRACLKSCAQFLKDWCPIQKEAIGYYDVCTLRYSNDSIFGVMKTESSYVYDIAPKTVVDDAFNRTLSGLLDQLKSTAAEGEPTKKFAEKSVKVIDESSDSNSNETIYGLAQCTPYLTEQDCIKCLDDAYVRISFWCLEMKACFYFGPSCLVRYDISPLLESIANNTESPAPQPSVPLPPKRNKSKLRTAIVIVLAIVVAGILFVGSICIYLGRRKATQFEANMEKYDDGGAEEELMIAESLQFNFDTIRVATSDFSNSNKLGQGGFGVVYRGKLPNGQMIAVKRLSTNSDQGDVEFKNEVLLVAKLQHRNLVRLLGFSLEGRERLLIYEFVSNKSLDFFIFDPTRKAQLSWEKRYNIIKGISRGLLYLHEDSRLRIIHRDLKASNILLDDEMGPKISDFGLARLFVIGQTQGSTNRIVGTYGYMAPEYAMHGEFSVKSDVYSFGVLVLEIISGHKNSANIFHGEDMEYLLSYAWRSWIEGRANEIIDPSLNDISQNEIMRCIHIGLLCIQENLIDRPTMASVALMLNSYSLTLSIPSKPAYFIGSGTRRLPNMQLHVDNVGETGLDESMNQVSITDPYPR